MKILGIDPGTTRIGYGVIEGKGDFSLVDYGVIEISAAHQGGRILELEEKFSKLLDSINPDCAGIERLYFSKNQKTALSVSEARGVLMLTLLKHGIPVTEHGPGEVKLAVTNYGSSDKHAVRAMVKRILHLSSLEGHDDASDALAIALTAGYLQAFKAKLPT